MKKIVIIVAVVAAPAVTGLVADFIFSGGLFANAMACSDGDAPANDAQGRLLQEGQ